MAFITYYSLSDYNNGELIPFTIQLDGTTFEEHWEEIGEALQAITEEKDDGEVREEIIVADYEGVPSEFVDTWSIDSTYFEMLEAMEASYLSEEAFLAGVALDIPFDRIDDAYRGWFNSDEDFAEEYCESTGMLAEVPDSLKSYFDMESFARDLMMDFNCEDGHVFEANW